MPTQKGGSRKSTRLSNELGAAVVVEENPSVAGGDNILSGFQANNNLEPSANLLSNFSVVNSEQSSANTELEALQSLQAELDKYHGGSEPGSSQTTSAAQLVTNNATIQVPRVPNSSVSSLVASHGQTVQLLKRPAVGTSAPVMTKVIITTKNPTPQQFQTVSVPATQTMTSLAPKTALGTPTKTISLSSIVSPMKTPTKQTLANKIAISPAKTPGKITMIAKSPQRIAPAIGSGTVMLTRTVTTTTAGHKPQTITMSPSRVVIRQQPSVSVAMSTSMSNQSHPPKSTVKQIAMPSVTAPNVHQIQVPGSKFHYVRLVTAPTSQSQPHLASRHMSIAPAQVKSIAPSATTSLPSQVRLAVPSGMQNIATAVSSQSVSSQQRLLLPANTTQIAIRPSASTASQMTNYSQIKPNATIANLAQLPPGTTILSSGSGQSVPGFALVPAQYVAQLQQMNSQQSQAQHQPEIVMQQKKTEPSFVPIMSNDPAISNSQQQRRNNVNGSTIYDAPGGTRPRKPCNCTKSQCLKLYCDCFANGEFCHNCNCNNCFNNLEHEDDRARAIKSCLDRNPHAFHPKIGKAGRGEGERRHQKGCNCKRSNCLKNYCECYEAKIMCSNMCKCVGCKNFEESPERKTLMNLADAAEVRALQQTAAKSKLSSQIQDLPSRPQQSTNGERLPYSFVTSEVAEATCACLVAQAEESERSRYEEEVEERLVLEEFGRCLMQVIDSANKTKSSDAEDSPL